MKRLAVHQLEATGTRDGTKFLRDDGTWAAPPTGGGGSAIGASLSRRLSNMASATGIRALTYDNTDQADTGFTVNAGAGTITVPSAGWYFLAGHVRITAATAGDHELVVADAATSRRIIRSNSGSMTATGLLTSGLAYLASGAVLNLLYYSSNATTPTYDADGSYTWLRAVLM